VVQQDQTGHADALIVQGQEWMRHHLLKADFSIEALALALGTSPHILVRRWKHATGTTPVGYLQDLRIDLAKNLLETTDLGLDAILDKIGYSDGAPFPRLFRQKTTLSLTSIASASRWGPARLGRRREAQREVAPGNGPPAVSIEGTRAPPQNANAAHRRPGARSLMKSEAPCGYPRRSRCHWWGDVVVGGVPQAAGRLAESDPERRWE